MDYGLTKLTNDIVYVLKDTTDLFFIIIFFCSLFLFAFSVVSMFKRKKDKIPIRQTGLMLTLSIIMFSASITNVEVKGMIDKLHYENFKTKIVESDLSKRYK
jgi:hypothetical protein